MTNPRRYLPVLLLLGLLPGAVTAADDKRVTTRYEVEDLVKRADRWQGPMTGAGRRKDALPALVRLVMTTTGADAWRREKDPATLEVINGTRLEVRTDVKHHKEIAELLGVLRRLTEVSVIAGAELYEVDRDFYKKEIEPKFAKAGPGRSFALPLDEGAEKGLRKHAEPVRQNKAILSSVEDTTLLSLRTAVLYLARPTEDGKEPYDTALPGVSFLARATASRDRRFVRLRLTQQTTELIELRKKKVVDLVTDKETMIEVPDLVESSTTAAVTVADGLGVLVQVHSQPRSVTDRGKVRVLLLRPAIQILEEEREKGKG